MRAIDTETASTDVLATSPERVLEAVAQRTARYDFSVWFWGDAIAMDGLLDAADLLASNSYRDFCLKYFRQWSRRQLSWPDHLTPGSALLRLYSHTGDRSLLDASLRLVEWIVRAPRPLGRTFTCTGRISQPIDTQSG